MYAWVFFCPESKLQLPFRCSSDTQEQTSSSVGSSKQNPQVNSANSSCLERPVVVKDLGVVLSGARSFRNARKCTSDLGLKNDRMSVEWTDDSGINWSLEATAARSKESFLETAGSLFT